MLRERGSRGVVVWGMDYVVPQSRHKVITHARCSSVSGTVKPREAPIIASASSAFIPKQINAQAAMTDERPMPARQWIATERPLCNLAASARAIPKAARRDSGNPRSGIGKEMKSMPRERQTSASRCKPSSITSSRSKRLTITSIPASFHASISVSNHSSARGRAIIAIRPVARSSIQCNRDIPNPTVCAVNSKAISVARMGASDIRDELHVGPC